MWISHLLFLPPNPTTCAIVIATNENCLGGGGVDGAINDAGGRVLVDNGRALPGIDGLLRSHMGGCTYWYCMSFTWLNKITQAVWGYERR